MTKPSPKLIGTFVLGAIALLVATLLAFGAGSFFRERDIAVSFFDGSIAGLDVGAPVAFRGVPVGTVTDIRIRVHRRTLNARIPVYYELDRSRITWFGNPSIPVDDRLRDVIRAGLRAQLTLDSLVTGQLAIQLVMRPNTSFDAAWAESDVTEIPTIASETEELKARFERVRFVELVAATTAAIERLNRLLASHALAKVPVALNATLHRINGLVADLRAPLPLLSLEVAQTTRAAQATLKQSQASMRALEDEASSLAGNLEAAASAAEETFRQAQTTLASADNLLADDGPTVQNLNDALEEVESAAGSIQNLAETIERNPTMFLRGR